MPTSKIYTKLFEYEIPGASDFEGMEYSSKIGIPNSGMNVEIGFKYYGNNSYEDQWFFNLAFNLSKINQSTSFVSDEAFERVSMKDRKYEKVRRDNIIVKSKSFSGKAGASAYENFKSVDILRSFLFLNTNIICEKSRCVDLYCVKWRLI